MQKTFSSPLVGSNTNNSKDTDKDNTIKRQPSNISDYKFALGGRGDKDVNNTRVDYQLQQGLVGNDYISSLVAHTSYFRNDDVINFIMELDSRIGSTVSDE